ncbi:UDP-N-acetylmuramoyl-tripeptide--D-alanyl-D-alanine ligase [bacterium]|nr:UDP-N-acetylmuramoyl-tripeptide--D-alanyl-D-alanine ligase [bacterium]
MQLTVLNILQDANGEWRGSAQALTRPARQVSTDSRSLQPGDLFFALQGDTFDGHIFVDDVLKKGALAAVVSRRWYDQNRSVENVLVVDDVLRVFQESAAAYRRRFDLQTIAVTGSAGKTTSKEMIYSVLSRRFHVLRNRKSFNNHVGVPTTLFEITPAHEMILTELGANHFGELDRLSYLVEPAIAVITNIGYAHLEFFGDLEGVRRAKFEVFNHCRPGAKAILNADDAMLANAVVPVSSRFTYGLEQTADLHAEVLGCDRQACYRFRMLDRTVQLQVPGRHNVSNALAAAAVALQFHLPPEEIQAGLESFVAVDQRMQVLSSAGVTLINDAYNANPSSCAAALNTCRDFAQQGNRLIAVLGDMLELGGYTEAEHRRLADRCAAVGVQLLCLCGAHTLYTLERAREIGGFEAVHFENNAVLAQSLRPLLRKGDVVLIKGSRGMHMETIVSALMQETGI